MATIEVDGLTKIYGDHRAVDGLSFTVPAGQVCALLGPNGAGKTTTVEILEGHRTADAGTARVLGFDPATGGRDFRERIGIVLQEAGFEEEYTVRELVRLYVGMYPRQADPDALLAQVGLTAKADARVKTLSGGQRRRLDLALGLAGDPEVLFLDEPTTGFDPAARRQAWQLVEQLRGGGTTILLTTHYLDEARHLADRVIVIAGGRLVWEGTPDELIDRTGSRALLRFSLPDGVAAAELPALPGLRPGHNGAVEVDTDDPVGAVHALSGWALERGHGLPGLALERRSLEEAYLELLGQVTPTDG